MGRPYLQKELSKRNNDPAQKSLEPIINPCAISLSTPPSRQPVAVSAIVSTFGTFNRGYSQESNTPTITLPTPKNIRQKQQAQLAFAAIAAANSRNNRLKDTEAINSNEDESKKFENENKAKLKENQYWV